MSQQQLIPLGKKHKIICPICRWEATRSKADVEQYKHQAHNPSQSGTMPQKQPGGYNVGYQ
ncbi:hypothetical protein OIO90_002828 [Microbotryomycetes sp. JL221]|nr:hypothetical protein OIO90_002828 [Microbotryomycetes sp. JL221]